MNTAIEIKNLTFKYDNKFILDNANAEIQSGDFVSIIGDNGAGKSTLMKIMLNLLTPYKGEVYILGKEIRNFKDWSKIGYVCQNATKSNIGFPATAEEVVQSNLSAEIGLFHFPKKKHKYMTLKSLEEVGMQQYSKQLIGSLSGGQQQRVMIARALVNNPDILILDEPESGIDYKSKLSLYSLLKHLNKNSGMTIIMVTHDKDGAADFVNKILYVKDGKITERLNNKETDDFASTKFIDFNDAKMGGLA